MRYAWFLVALLAVGCASTQTVDESHHEPAPAGVTRARIDVAGLSCPLCAESIVKSLEDLAGVADADLDLEAGVVHVALDPDRPATEAQMRKAVDWAGFTVLAFRFHEAGDQ